MSLISIFVIVVVAALFLTFPWLSVGIVVGCWLCDRPASKTVPASS